MKKKKKTLVFSVSGNQNNLVEDVSEKQIWLHSADVLINLYLLGFVGQH